MSSDLDPDLSKNISCSLSIQPHLPSTCNIVHSAATFMFYSSLSLGHPFWFVFLTDSVVFITFVTLSPQTPPPKHYFRLEILVAVSRETLFVLILPFRRHGEIQWKKQSSNSFLRRFVAFRRTSLIFDAILSAELFSKSNYFYFRIHGSPYRFP